MDKGWVICSEGLIDGDCIREQMSIHVDNVYKAALIEISIVFR